MDLAAKRVKEPKYSHDARASGFVPTYDRPDPAIEVANAVLTCSD